MARATLRSIVDAWTDAYGENTAKVMNDSTKSDVIVRLTDEENEWLRLQLKTTSGNNKKNSWAFRRVTGYSGMPVVCWRCDKKDAWVFDGAKLDERGKRDLAVTPGARNGRKLALASGRKLADLVGDLAALLSRKGNADLWPTVTEEQAQNELASKTHRLERLGILAYIERNSKAGTVFSNPKDQGTHVDLVKVETHDGKQVKTRLQFKTARKSPNGGAGFICDLCTSAGSYKGKKKVQPYQEGAFDELVAVAWVEDEAGKQKPEFWVIPEEALKEQGYLRSESGDNPGMIMLPLHSQNIGEQPKQNARKQANTWTREFHVGEQRVRD